MLLIWKTELDTQPPMLGCRKIIFKTGCFFFPQTTKKTTWRLVHHDTSIVCTWKKMVTLPQGHQKVSRLWYVKFSPGCPEGRRSYSQKCTECVCPLLHKKCNTYTWHEEFCGAVIRRTQRRRPLCAAVPRRKATAASQALSIRYSHPSCLRGFSRVRKTFLTDVHLVW